MRNVGLLVLVLGLLASILMQYISLIYDMQMPIALSLRQTISSLGSAEICVFNQFKLISLPF